MGVDYEKIAEGVVGPEVEAETASEPMGNIDPSEQAKINRQYLPLDHDKYQGIGASKGYLQGDDYSGNRLKRVHYSHEAMIDVLITEPTITQNELAKRFEKSVSWISIVMGSDAFQGALAKRRDDVLNPEIIASIEERYRGLAMQSLEVISSKLESSRNTDLALKSLEISGKALGFGARGGQTNNVQNNFVVALPPKVADAAAWAAQHSQPLIER